MTLCSVCKAIDIPSLPPFTGFNQTRDAESSTPIGQPHHQFQALRESAASCLLCSLLFKQFMKAGTARSRGIIGYGPELNQRFHSIPRDEDIVLLMGLSRSGWNEKGKCLYGFQALCGTLRCHFGLFAAEGLNLLIVNLCPLHARAESLQVQHPRSLTLLLRESLGQLSNVIDL
jgi:hypothetical protein